jgi:hypothetical protein
MAAKEISNFCHVWISDVFEKCLPLHSGFRLGGFRLSGFRLGETRLGDTIEVDNMTDLSSAR